MPPRRHVKRTLARVTRQLAILVEQLVEEQPDDDPIDGLPPMEQAILEALQDGRPLPGKRVARAAGYSYSARIRSTLADLTRRGLLIHGPDGYQRRAETAAPQQRTSPT